MTPERQDKRGAEYAHSIGRTLVIGTAALGAIAVGCFILHDHNAAVHAFSQVIGPLGRPAGGPGYPATKTTF